jgi:sugar phosphate isomerase/epimerase
MRASRPSDSTTTIGGYVRDGGSVDEIGAPAPDAGFAAPTSACYRSDSGEATAAAGAARTATMTGAGVHRCALRGRRSRRRDSRAARAANVLGDAGVRIAFEFTAYGHRRSLRDAIELCRAVGWKRCGLLVDTWHVFRGGEPLTLLRSLDAEQIALVHVNDAAPQSGLDPVLLDPVFEGRFRRALPGAGTFPLGEFAEALAATGYRGTISVEVLSTELRQLPPHVGARQLLQSLRESLA